MPEVMLCFALCYQACQIGRACSYLSYSRSFGGEQKNISKCRSLYPHLTVMEHAFLGVLLYCRKLSGSARRGAGIEFLCLFLSFLMLSSCGSTVLCLKQRPLNVTPTSVGLGGHILPHGWSSLCCTISGRKALCH